MPGETENGENCISTEKLTVMVLHSPKTLSLLFPTEALQFIANKLSMVIGLF